MYIRCLDCQSSTWIESVEPGSAAQHVSCRTCGREYALNVPADLGATQRDQYRKALGFAESHGIDLPSAYSVLLGIMSMDEARGLRERAVSAAAKDAVARVAARQAAPAPPRRKSPGGAEAQRKKESRVRPRPAAADLPSFDPGFSRAVQAGTLTAAQAMERGNRKLMADRLVRTHGLPRRLAYEITDNRISLQAALRQHAERKVPSTKPRSHRLTQRQRTWITGIVSVAFMVLAVNGVCLWHGYTREAQAAEGLSQVVAQQAAVVADPAPAEPEPDGRMPDSVEVHTDALGRILAIAGPNPREVLIRFCQAASSSAKLEPVGLTSTVPPFPGTRLGLIRDLDRLDALLAIRIRRESDSHRWITGDGSRPIVVAEAPPLPADAEQIPVALP